MGEHIVLRDDPKMEFQLHEHGFAIKDARTKQNSDFYAYDDIQLIELNNTWVPTLVKWLRYTTWLLNGAPLAGESSNKANLVIDVRTSKFKIWLTDTDMVDKAKKLAQMLSLKSNYKLA